MLNLPQEAKRQEFRQLWELKLKTETRKKIIYLKNIKFR